MKKKEEGNGGDDVDDGDGDGDASIEMNANVIDDYYLGHVDVHVSFEGVELFSC